MSLYLWTDFCKAPKDGGWLPGEWTTAVWTILVSTLNPSICGLIFQASNPFSEERDFQSHSLPLPLGRREALEVELFANGQRFHQACLCSEASIGIKRTGCVHCCSLGLISGWRTEIPQAMQYGKQTNRKTRRMGLGVSRLVITRRC